MSKVKFPVISVTYDKTKDNPLAKEGNINDIQVNPSCLRSYLGYNGAGRIILETGNTIKVSDQCMPELMYYDIFKNYYANLQEENAYYIDANSDIKSVNVQGTDYNPNNINAPIKNKTAIAITVEEGIKVEDLRLTVQTFRGSIEKIEPKELGTVSSVEGAITISVTSTVYTILLKAESIYGIGGGKLSTFKISEVDLIREKILQAPTNVPYDLGASAVELMTKFRGRTNNYLNTTFPQFGLCVKTYQSDLFNNWINTEWIDGENGISEITSVSVTGGSFTIDALNLAQKVYNMMNRIAVSGGSYRDWIETVYTSNYIERAETPVYMGGMSDEIVFQEVIGQSATEQEPLGSLAGRGKLAYNKKGGYLKIKVEEPSYIIGIVSITPRIDYSQGTKWDRNLQTMNDLHKPALDAIGFQDLVTSKMAWWDTYITAAETGKKHKFSAGKQPAWIDYMTNYNKTYGNFAVGESESFMVLNRIYQTEWEGNTPKLNNSTYIDPQAYNYVFADTDLQSMNFWVQIGFDIEARIVMSAKVS